MIRIGICRRHGLFGGLSKPLGHTTFKRSLKTSTFDWKPIRGAQGNLASIEHHSKTLNFRKFVLGLMIAMPIISFGLGCWQVKRLAWKSDLLALCENNLSRPPLQGLPPATDPKDMDKLQFRRFKARGHYIHSQEMFLGPRMHNGALGYLVITPFQQTDGQTFLVERGWISKDKVIPNTREGGYLLHLARPSGEVEINGVFRVMGEKLSLTFDHKDDARLFHSHDVASMALQLGASPIYSQLLYDLSYLPKPSAKEAQAGSHKSKSWLSYIFLKGESKSQNQDLAETSLANQESDPTLVYQEFEFIDQGVPLGIHPKVRFSNNHAQYLVTWFGLSAASVVLLGWSFLRKRNSSSAERVIEAKRKDMGQNW